MPYYQNEQKIYRLSGSAIGTTTLTFYRFKIKDSISPGKYFEIFDDSGNLCFSDTEKYLKILESHHGIIPHYHYGSENPVFDLNYVPDLYSVGSTISVGKKLAVIINNPVIGFDMSGYGTPYLMTAFTFPDNASKCNCNMKWVLFSDPSDDHCSGGSYFNYTVVDVSNM
jgi:hypothetical protein